VPPKSFTFENPAFRIRSIAHKFCCPVKKRRVVARERPQYAVWTRAVVAVNAAGEAAQTNCRTGETPCATTLASGVLRL